MNTEERERIAQEVIDTRSTWPAVYDGVAAVAITEALRLAIPADCVVVKREDVDQLLVAAKIFAGTAEELDSIMDDDVRVRLTAALGDA